MDGYSFNPRKVNGFHEKWFANNCLVRYEYPIAENDTNLCAIRDMLDALVETGDVPDYDFFINKRDYPILAEGKYEPYNHISLPKESMNRTIIFSIRKRTLLCRTHIRRTLPFFRLAPQIGIRT
jgi:hypothetical protein